MSDLMNPIEQTGLLEGTRCVSCRSLAIGFGGSTKHCRSAGELVELDSVACSRFVHRGDTDIDLAGIELSNCDYKLETLSNRLDAAWNNHIQAKQDALDRDAAFHATQGYVYFIECEGYTKIGYTYSHPETGGRYGCLGVIVPFDVVLWGYARGPMELEKFLHRCFASRRVKGEWFALNAGDKRELARIAARTSGHVNPEMVDGDERLTHI